MLPSLSLCIERSAAQVTQQIARELDKCDLLLIVGTSGVVYPG
jgi:NAD-dependent SIR2 family protein deacetylase